MAITGGPLVWMHALHHQQHNPCRQDSSYIHPLEVALGLGLYTATTFLLSRFMGSFHVATVVVTWLAFTEINLHNHDLRESDRLPFRYLNYVARMHHNHHAKFLGGNVANKKAWAAGAVIRRPASGAVAPVWRCPRAARWRGRAPSRRDCRRR